jgi:hypothetical protein
MKKSLLAGCIALATAGAHAELTPLSEFDLHNVTGQAGIDIELDVGIEIGEIRYTDTEVITQETIQVDPDGDGIFEDQIINVSDGDGGSLSIKGLTIGGGEGRDQVLGQPGDSNTARLDNLKFTIDIDENGDLQIGGKPTLGGVGVVDFAITVDEVSLLKSDESQGAILIDQMNMYGGIGFFDVTVSNETRTLADSSSQDYTNIRIVTELGIDELDVDMSSSLGLVIEDAVIGGKEYFEQIADNGKPALTGRLATIRANIFTHEDGDKVSIDFSANSSSTNVFDMDLAKVSLGGDLVGGIAIDNLDIRGVKLHMGGHN